MSRALRAKAFAMPQKFKRSRLLVDTAFQFRLLARMAFYLLAYTLVVFHIGFAFEVMATIASQGLGEGGGHLYLEYLERQRPLLFALVLITPILLYDLLKFSHRIAGPLF